MLIDCQECGREISDKAPNCLGCGAPQSALLGAPIKCAECSSDVYLAYRACPVCGAPRDIFLNFADKVEQVLEPIASDNPSRKNSQIHARGRSASGLWARYFAKQVDLLLFFIPAIVLSALLIAISAPFFGVHADDVYEEAAVVVGLLMLVFFALIEGVWISLFGSTPGKSLFGISLRDFEGRKLRLSKSVSRSVRALLQGLGMGIPLIALFTQISAWSYVKEHGTTGWDRNTGTNYNSNAVHPFRWSLGILLTILSFLSFVILASAGASNSY